MKGCPPDTYRDLDAAKEAATTARIRRALRGRRAGGSTTQTKYCTRCSGWHLVNTQKRGPR